MSRRPAAHNPMVFRKVAPRPAPCGACGEVLADVPAAKAHDCRAVAEFLDGLVYHSGSDPADTGLDLNNPADR